MKTHAHILGKDSSWFNDPKYGEEYRNILKEQKNKLRTEGNILELHKKKNERRFRIQN